MINGFIRKGKLALILAVMIVSQVAAQISVNALEAVLPIVASECDERSNVSIYRNAIKGDADGAWIKFDNVRFGEDGVKSVKVLYSAVGGNAVGEIHIDSANGYKIADIEFTETANKDVYEMVSGSTVNITGNHDIYFVFRGNSELYIKTLWFSDEAASDVAQAQTQVPYWKKGISENTRNNVIMFVGSSDIYVSNVPESINAPVYRNDSGIMYPIEAVAKGTGGTYSCENGTVTIVAVNGNKIRFNVGENTYILNGETKELPVAVEKINGEIFVPETILQSMMLKIYKNEEGFIAVSDSEDWLLNEKDESAEIEYLTSVYTADEVDTDAIQIYVATNGNDSAAGTINAPLKTFEGARNKVRALKAKGMTKDIVVNFRGGFYNMDSTVDMTEEDSGENGHRVIYRSYEGEEATFGFYEVLNWEDFTGVEDKTITERFDENVRDKVMQIDLKKYGITSYGMIFPRLYGATLYAPVELYINSKPQTLARFPNEGFIQCSSVITAGSKFASTGGDGTLSMPAVIGFEEEEPLSWQDSDDIYLYGQWDFGWVTNEQKPIIDKTRKEMTLQYMSFGVTRTAGTRYYYKNVLEELDIPGEYYIDRDSGIMYVYPTENMENAEIVVTKMIEGTEVDEWKLALEVAKNFGAANTSLKPTNAKYTIMNFDNVSNVTIDGLNFKYTPGTAITTKDGYNLIFKNAEISCAGIRAFEINGGYDHVIKNCNMHDLGGGGIDIANAGDRNSLTSSGIKILGCEIIDYDLITGGYSGAVYISGVGVTVKNNRIAGSKHFAVGYYGNDNVIQYNDISDVMQISDDAGAIYSFADCTFLNNDISYNYFHDTKRAFHFSDDEGEAGLTHNLVTAIYADNYVSGNICVGNVAENFGSYLMFVHGGRNNDIFNNIYVSTGDKNVGTGIIRTGGSSDGAPLNTLNAVPKDSALWRERYPMFAQALDNMGTFGQPQYNKVNGNIIYAKGIESLEVSQIDDTVENKNNILFNTAANEVEGANLNQPFVDVEKRDYRVKNIGDFENTIGDIDNAADYANMGLSAEYPFADQNEDIKRLFIKSDKFNSGVANYKAKQGEQIQLEVIARSTSGYVLDLSDADITFTSNNSNVATVNGNGLITVNNAGVAQITANVKRGSENHSIYVNIYCGEGEWADSKTYARSEVPYSLYLNFEKSETENAAMVINGNAYFEINTVLKPFGFELEKTAEYIKASKDTGEIRFYPDKNYMDYGKNRKTLESPVCISCRGKEYVTKEFVQELGALVNRVASKSAYYVDFEKDDIKLDISAMTANVTTQGRTIDVSELLLKEDKWNINGMNGSFENGILKLLPGGERNTAAFVEKLGGADSVRMKLKGDFGGSWYGIALKCKSVWSDPWAAGYLLCIYEDRLEMQSFGTSSGNVWFVDTPNNYLRKNEWSDVEFGAVNTGKGVELYLTVDGAEVFRVTDSNTPILDDGYFAVYTGGGTVEIAGADTVVE